MSDVPDPTGPAETPPRPAPAARAPWLRRLRLPALVVAGIVAIAAVVGMPMPPVWPFVTLGRIYVESPGVYTRERLVNDRYRQDFWLRAQMERLDEESNLVGLVQSSRIVAGSGSTLAAAGQDDLELPFPADFALRSAIRDKIRQRILENQLDDRHDLTGNSIYGLKFETAVVPGTNTVARPYVVVRMDAETLPRELGAADYLADPQSASEPERGSRFRASWTQFTGWRRNLERRLNAYLELAVEADERCAPGAPQPPVPQAPADEAELAKVLPLAEEEAAQPAAAPAAPARPEAPAHEAAEAGDGWAGVDRDQLAGALRQVMAVENREIRFAPWWLGGDFGTVDLPDPWSSFFQLQVWRALETGQRGVSCPKAVYFQLRPVYVTLYPVDLQAWRHWQQYALKNEDYTLRELSTIGNNAVVARQFRVATSNGGRWQPEAGTERFVGGLSTVELDALISRGTTAPLSCIASDPPLWEPSLARRTCTLQATALVVNASLFEFIRMIAQSTPYAYAVFPRGDVEGVLSARAVEAGIAAPQSENLGLAALLQSREAGAEPVVVNFGGGRSTGVALGEFDFGWAMVREGRQRPAQVSQLVLVSVPAYLEALDLWVETGWLDRQANPIGPPADPDLIDTPRVMPAGERQITKMRVALPPDYEALDTLVAGGTRRQGPVINELALPDTFTVRACANADILIPGDRLWRSTSVSIGGQIADRVTVLPDMRGIVASFEPVRLPLGNLSSVHSVQETLEIWTSEGSERLPAKVTIVVPASLAGERACPRDSAPE